MTRNEYIEWFFHEYCLPLLQTKGADYTEGLAQPSPNGNFQVVADMVDNPAVTKYTIWLVYFTKHLTALLKWLKKGTLASEPVEGRIADMVNYLLILQSMRWEDQPYAEVDVEPPTKYETRARIQKLIDLEQGTKHVSSLSNAELRQLHTFEGILGHDSDAARLDAYDLTSDPRCKGMRVND
jgi:hypothetical protein